MDAELLESLDACLTAAEEVSQNLPESHDGGLKADRAVIARLQWIERQLATMTAKLKAIQEDIGAGLSLHEMGFADPQELLELLHDMSIQIAQLKAMGLALGRGVAQSF